VRHPSTRDERRGHPAERAFRQLHDVAQKSDRMSPMRARYQQIAHERMRVLAMLG
jgi:hypothetical protein